MKAVFWCSVGVVLYTFVIYPLLLVLLASLSQFWSDLRFAYGRDNRRRIAVGEPKVSLVIAAHNEEAVIGEKMRNSAVLDYPKDRLQILVGCDGCSDNTAELARASMLWNLKVIDYGNRSGKPAMLNKLVPEADGDILLFSDANTLFSTGSIRSIVRRFTSPEVGAVCGELRLMTPGGKPASEGLYWRYECFLKILESRLNMLVGANGAIFAIRRSLYRPLPPTTINDDFLLAMDIRRQGYQVVYDPEACCYEETSNIQQEFRRRVRIGSGDLRALKETWRMLSPTAGRVALAYWSHKICRWLVPFAMPAAFVSAVFLSHELLYFGFAILGLVLAGAGVIGYVLEQRKQRIGPLSMMAHFLAMNLALMIGFMKDLAGDRAVTWTPTARDLTLNEEAEKVDVAGA
jgi:cellulose synthase/poly-beta-1,6-N-acetylglucosamine synthase-like glycosyltransferase